MPAFSKHKLTLTTIVYWVLLLYILAALIWWAISLLQQNQDMFELKRAALPASTINYTAELQKIEDQRKRNIEKFIGEGSVFSMLILIGAGFIYRSVRRQFKVQQQQQNFVMAVTHELKTPIAVSRLNLETLQKYQLSEEKKKKLLQTTLQETLRLDTLINNILISSQLEDSHNITNKEELNFSDLLEDAIKEFCCRYPERSMIKDIEEEVELVGDATLLKLLVSNLLENAHKYSECDKQITVVLQRQGSKIYLTIADEGKGIADKEKKAVFQKFYRIGDEKIRKEQGTGLGLYISKKIAADHQAQISIIDNQPQGSKFIIQFVAT